MVIFSRSKLYFEKPPLKCEMRAKLEEIKHTRVIYMYVIVIKIKFPLEFEIIVKRRLNTKESYIYIYIYICACVCVCDCYKNSRAYLNPLLTRPPAISDSFKAPSASFMDLKEALG